MLPSSTLRELKERLKVQSETEYERNIQLWRLAKKNIGEERKDQPFTIISTPHVSSAIGSVVTLFPYEPTVSVIQTEKPIEGNNTVIRGEDVQATVKVEEPTMEEPLQESLQNNPEEQSQETISEEEAPILEEEREVTITNSSCPFGGIPPIFRNNRLLKPTKEQIFFLQAARSTPPSKIDWIRRYQQVLNTF